MIAATTAMLAADPALPFRDALLDMRTVDRLLGQHVVIAPTRAAGSTLVRTNYQVGKSLRAVFRVRVDGRAHIVAARMFCDDRSASAYVDSQSRAVDLPGLRGVAHAAEFGCVFWAFPNDRRIDALRSTEVETESCAAVAAAPPLRRRLVAYAPEKSATFVCEDGSGRAVAYAKVAAAHQAERDGQTYRELRAGLPDTDPRLYLPRPLAYDPARRTLWIEAIAGRRFADVEASDTSTDALRRLGRAVAAFHGLQGPRAPRFERFASDHLGSNATLIGRVRPDVAGAARALAERLSRTTPSDPPRLSCLHGDLHPKNAIVLQDRVALIDVEDVAIGPAAGDIGSLLASLLYLHVCGRITRSKYAADAAAFTSGYDSDAACRPKQRDLAWHVAAALLVERAARAVTRMRPLGLAHLGAIITAAERTLDRGLEL